MSNPNTPQYPQGNESWQQSEPQSDTFGSPQHTDNASDQNQPLNQQQGPVPFSPQTQFTAPTNGTAPQPDQYQQSWQVQPDNYQQQPFTTQQGNGQQASGQQAQFQPPMGQPQFNQPPMAPQLMAPPMSQPWYGISFIQAIKRFFMKYVTFSGRASRSEYWWSQLFLALVAIVLTVIDGAINNTALSDLWNLGVLIPTLAISVRRLHDTNKSGWWLVLPYGLDVLAFIIAIAGLLSMGISIASADSSESFFGSISAIIWVLAVVVILMVAAAACLIVLMVLSSRPEGARFDKAPVAPNPAQAPGMSYSYAGNQTPAGQANTNQNAYYAQPQQQNPQQAQPEQGAWAQQPQQTPNQEFQQPQQVQPSQPWQNDQYIQPASPSQQAYGPTGQQVQFDQQVQQPQQTSPAWLNQPAQEEPNQQSQPMPAAPSQGEIQSPASGVNTSEETQPQPETGSQQNTDNENR